MTLIPPQLLASRAGVVDVKSIITRLCFYCQARPGSPSPVRRNYQAKQGRGGELGLIW